MHRSAAQGMPTYGQTRLVHTARFAQAGFPGSGCSFPVLPVPFCCHTHLPGHVAGCRGSKCMGSLPLWSWEPTWHPCPATWMMTCRQKRRGQRSHSGGQRPRQAAVGFSASLCFLCCLSARLLSPAALCSLIVNLGRLKQVFYILCTCLSLYGVEGGCGHPFMQVPQQVGMGVVGARRLLQTANDISKNICIWSCPT